MKSEYHIGYKNTKLFSGILVFVLIIISAFSFELPVSAAMSFIAKPAQPNTDTEISLQWGHVNGAGYYAVTRGNAGSEEIIYVSDVNKSLNYLSYIDKGSGDGGLAPETGYTYTVYACRNIVNTLQDLNSENIIDKATALVATSKMLKPVIASAKFNINDRSVSIKCTNNSRAAAVVNIGVVSNGSVLKVSDSDVIRSGIDYCVIRGQDIPDGAARQYVAMSEDNSGHSSLWSEPVSVTAASAPSVKALAQNGNVTLSWGSYPYISSFQLERAKYDVKVQSWGGWQVVKPQFYAGTSNTTDILPLVGSYRYRLNAKSASGFEGAANAVPELVNKPGAPTNLSCKIADVNSIDISWVNNSGNLSRLLLQRKRLGDVDYSTIAELSSSDTTYKDIFNVARNTTYYYRLVAIDSENNKDISRECLIKADPPAAPSSLNLTVESSSIRLNWRSNASSGEYFSFRIDRKIDGGSYSQLATVTSDKTTYVDEDNISDGHTYYYRVCAFNPIGSSAYTNEVSTTTAEIAAPNSLEVTPISSTELELKWSYPETGSARTVIERKTGADGSWSIITSSPLASNVIRYVDRGLSPNTQYFYRVKAVSPFNLNVFSRPYPNNDTGAFGYTKLGALALFGHALSFNEIYLWWNGTGSSTEYIIERKSASGNFSSIATVTSGTTYWRDNNLVPNAQYTYRVKAKNEANESVYSNEFTVTNSYMGAPTNLTATIAEGSHIELSWIDNAMEETGYEIWRCVSSSGFMDWSLYKTVGQNVQRFNDTNVQPGVQYNYRVRAYSAVGNIYSSYSNTASVGVGMLNPPSNLTFDVISEKQVSLSWKDNSNDETGFRVERKIGADGIWTEISSLSINTTSYTASGLNPYTQYFFRIKAYSYKYNSEAYSNEVEVSTGVPKAPSGLFLETVSSGRIDLIWVDNSTNEQGFIIERKESGTASYRKVTQVDSEITFYHDTGLKPGTRYYYRVKAYNKSGTSSPTNANTNTRAAATFNDIKNISWAKAAITDLASRGVVSGKNGNSFKPYDTITRAEFTCIIVRAFKFGTTPVGSFADVKPGKWYYSELMSAKAMGIISGDGDNRFHPDKPITREDMAVIIAKALKAFDKPLDGYSNSVLEKFYDKNLIAPHAIASLASLYGEGIISGKPGNMISPKDRATRAEAAVMVHRIIDR